jgi:predicted metal-dependent enzyme (double-stranded beta helix superfamily)
MFDLDDFIDDCRAAVGESEPRGAVKAVLSEAMARPQEVAQALKPEQSGFTVLYGAPDLTVLHVVWAPHMDIFPHDHRMWAAIGIYAGQEDNTFYRRVQDERRTITETGGKELKTGDVVLLGDDTVHSVHNPKDHLTGAIHVYGGDFVTQPRSQWGPGPREERPYDIEAARAQFAAANSS